MRSKRALAILTSLVLAIGTLSVSTFAADNSATAPTSSAAEDACANGHDYELKNEVGPTCTEDGYREEVCSRCGDTRRVEGEKALGHDFSGEGRVTREATTDREGELTFTCLRDDCNETKTEAIPKLEKTAEDTAEAPASSNQSQQDQNQADQTSQQESDAQNADQVQDREAVQNNANTTVPDAQNATLSIAGIPVPQEKGTIKAGKSKIKFKREGEGNQEEITLTFDDSKLVVNGSSKKQPPEAVIAYTGTGTLNISIEGENTVTGKNSSYGVYAPDGTVKLTGRKGASLDIQAASENSNTIRAKEIVVDDSLEIAGPENNYVYEGSNGMGGTYQTIAVANNGRNMAVSKVTIQDPNAGEEDKKDTEEKEEETKDEEKTDEKTDAAQDDADQNDTDKDDTAGGNDQNNETVTESQEEKNTENNQKQEETEGTEAAKDDRQTEDESKTTDESSQEAPASTRKKLGVTRGLLGTPPDENNTGNITGNTTGNNTSDNGNNDTVTTTGLHIDGKEITDASGSVTAGEGTIEYKVSANSGTGKNDVEITLNKAELTSTADAAISYMGDGTLTIILKGENKLTGTDHAIYAPFAQLTVEGEKENDMTGTSQNTVGSPAAIVAKKIIIKSPLEVTDPEEYRIAEIETTVSGQNATYQNIAEGKESGNAALTVKIEVPHYTVTYVANGGTGNKKPEEIYKGDKLTLPKENIFTAPAKSAFDYWDVNGENKKPEDEISITGPITVKAIWKAVEDQHQHEKTEVPGKEATCTEEGVIKHYKCKGCGKLFSDEAMTKEISESDTVIKAGHKLEKVEKQDKTCTKGGQEAHYKCTVCGKLFSDSDGRNEVQAKDLVIKAGHEWDMSADGIAAKMSSDGSQITYTFKCLNCDETKTVTVDLTEDNTVLPTKNKDGSLHFETSLDGKKASSTVAVAPAGTKGYSFTVPQKRNAAVWVKNSKDSLGFTIKRSEYDTITFPEYQNGGSILVDKKKVDSKNYTVEKGSLKITFKPSYLNTLSAGTHTLHVNFGDGSVEEKFTVNASSATGNGTAARTTNATTNRTANATTNRTANGSPRTGDTSNWALWIGLIAVSVIAIAAIYFVRKRGKKDEAAETTEADKKAEETGSGDGQA